MTTPAQSAFQPVPRQQLQDFCIRAMCMCGMDASAARVAVDVLVTTDLWGVFSHGTKSLRQYLKRMREGGLKSNARPHVVSEGPAWAVYDGDDALAMVSCCQAMELAVTKARAVGLGMVTLRNSCHFGAAGYYAMLAARHGMIGLAMSNADPNMCVPGGKGKIIGNNPMAYAIPAEEGRPLILDMALSAVAAGKINIAAEQGKSVPSGWLADEEGSPTTNPALYPAHANLMPMAGHKGYGLAVLVEVLSAILPGAGLLGEVISWNCGRDSVPTGHGAAFIAIDVQAMIPPDQFKSRIESMIRSIRSAPKAAGSDRIYLPGEMEWDRHSRAMVEGIPLPQDVRNSLRGLRDDLCLTVPWL